MHQKWLTKWENIKTFYFKNKNILEKLSTNQSNNLKYTVHFIHTNNKYDQNRAMARKKQKYSILKFLYMRQGITLKQDVWPIKGKMAINRNSLRKPRHWTQQSDFKSAILSKIKTGKEIKTKELREKHEDTISPKMILQSQKL